VRPSIQNEPIITCSNRHDALLQDANDLNNKDNDIEITPQKFDNVTKRKRGKSNTQRNDSRKVVAVIGDSMLKNIQGYKLSI